MTRTPEDPRWGVGAASEVPRQLPQETTRPTVRWGAWMQEQLRRAGELVRPVARYSVQESLERLRLSIPDVLQTEGHVEETPQATERTVPTERARITIQAKRSLFTQQKEVFEYRQELFQLMNLPDNTPKKIANKLLTQAMVVSKEFLGDGELELLAQLAEAQGSSDRASQATYLRELTRRIPSHWVQGLYVFLVVGKPTLADVSLLNQVYREEVDPRGNWHEVQSDSDHFFSTRSRQEYPRGSFAFAAESYLFLRGKVRPAALTEAEMSTFMGLTEADILLSNTLRTATDFMAFYGANGEFGEKYHHYLSTQMAESELAGIAILRNSFTEFLQSGVTMTWQFRRNLVSKALELSDALGLYDEHFFIALGEKYRLLAHTQSLSDFEDTTHSIAHVRGIALDSSNIAFLRQLLGEQDYSHQVLQLLYEMTLAVQMADSDVTVLQEVLNAVSKLLELSTTEKESPEKSELLDVRFGSTIEEFGTHFEYIESYVAERIVDIYLSERGRPLSNADQGQLLKAARVLKAQPIKYEERQQVEIDAADVATDLDLEQAGFSETEQLLSILKGFEVETLHVWGILSEVAEQDGELHALFVREIEQRMATALQDTGDNRIQQSRWSSAPYEKVVQFTSPINQNSRRVRRRDGSSQRVQLGVRDIDDLQQVSWVLAAHAPEDMLDTSARERLLLVSEAALRSSLERSFNLRKIELLLRSILLKRIMLLGELGNETERPLSDADAIARDMQSIWQLVQSAEVWGQDYREEYLESMRKRGREQLVLNYDLRARDTLLKFAEQYGFLDPAEKPRLQQMITRRKNQLRSDS